MAGWDYWWHDLAVLVAAELDGLRWNQFLIVDYDLVRLRGAGLYAQASRQPSGYYCEVVSGEVLREHVWPFDPAALTRGGWCPPDASTSNWFLTGVPSALIAGGLLLRSLVEARGCDDPDLIFLTVGSHPPGGGGEPEPAAAKGPSRVAMPGERWAA